MIPLKCIIVDDEPASLEIVEQYVSDCPHLQLIKRCRNAFEAIEVLNEQEVHLIFLDINMPKLSGMSFYKSLSNPPMVIFTTAYPQYAVEGFEVEAVDYLLKPFSFERFLTAVNKAVSISSMDDESSSKHILLKADKKIYRIVLDDITHLKAVGDYVKLYYSGHHILVHNTFRNILEALPNERIIRVHKSYAVALDKIEVITGNIIKVGGDEIAIGQTFRQDLMSALENN